ncbi:MAG: DinB family protein [Flavobacteriales bacterium]|nr:DinB family protein [Flavobacteriales bacterium]
MNTQLLPYWEALVAAKEQFLNELDTWTEDARKSPPGEGWSAIQVMEHVMSAEAGTLGYMKKKTSGGWEILERTGEENFRNSRAVNERLQSPERYAAPSVLPPPTGSYPYEDMKAFWNQQRDDMRLFFESLAPEFYDRLVFRQPIAGLLNVFQTLEFMRYHLEHHLPQLQRIKAAIQ